MSAPPRPPPPPPPPPGQHAQTWHGWRPPPPPPASQPTPASVRPPQIPPSAPPHPPPPVAPKRKDADPLDILDEIDFDDQPEPTPTKPKVSEAPPTSGTKPTSKDKSKAKQTKNKGIARQTQHSKELISAFKPIKYFLTIIGQMPFVIKPKKDGTYSFKFYKFSGQVFLYFTMLLISLSLYALVTGGVISFILDSVFSYIDPKHTVM